MVSEAMQQAIELLDAPIDDGATVEEQRVGLEERTGWMPPPEGTEIEYVELDGFDAEWIHGPGSTDAGAVLYLHGGGYCIGSITTHRALAAHLSQAAGLPVLLPAYRLAPEHPHPAAVDDARAAYRWLEGRGLAPGALAVAGDSAGGGLALALSLALREESAERLPAAVVLLSPWTDLTLANRSITANAATDLVVTAEGLGRYATWYAPETAWSEPLVSPGLADLAGLPPLLVQVGEPEILVDDATATAARAEAAGVEVTLEVWPDLFHVWHATAGMTPEADEALATVGRFIADRVGSG